MPPLPRGGQHDGSAMQGPAALLVAAGSPSSAVAACERDVASPTDALSAVRCSLAAALALASAALASAASAAVALASAAAAAAAPVRCSLAAALALASAVPAATLPAVCTAALQRLRRAGCRHHHLRHRARQRLEHVLADVGKRRPHRPSQLHE